VMEFSCRVDCVERNVLKFPKKKIVSSKCVICLLTVLCVQRTSVPVFQLICRQYLMSVALSVRKKAVECSA